MSVLSHLNYIGSNLVLTNSEKESIRTSINALSMRLDAYFDNIDVHYVFGSFDRGTILPRYVDENSDVDYMVIFNDGEEYSPQTLMDRLKRFVEHYYTRSEIHQSSPTIVLELNHIKFELVPAYEDWWSDLYIPAPASSYSDWISTNPKQLKENLLEKNKSNNYEIKKLIRILKYWNVNHGKVYPSYELEKYIIEKAYWWCKNIKDYFYSAVSGLSTYNLPEYKENKVNRLKEVVSKVKEYEKDDMPYNAESELKKVIPDF